MPRHDTLIIKQTHRGLLYEDGIFRSILPAGRYQIPREPSPLESFFGAKGPRVEVALVDIRDRDRTVAVHDLLAADGATISASFAVQFRVADPQAAVHRVKNFEDRLVSETQTAARRVLRGLSVEEILGSRDEIGEEMLLQVREAASPLGLEVSGLDFKDLVIPDDLRKLMNRAVAARRLRQLSAADDASLDDETTADEPLGENDSGLMIARATFARPGDAVPSDRPIRDRDRDHDRDHEALVIRPLLPEPRAGGFAAGGPDGARLRRHS